MPDIPRIWKLQPGLVSPVMYVLLRVRKLAQHANSLDEFAHWAQYANSSTSSHVRTEYAKSCLSIRTRTFYLERKRTLFVIRIRCIQYAYSDQSAETKTRTQRVCVLERPVGLFVVTTAENSNCVPNRGKVPQWRGARGENRELGKGACARCGSTARIAS